MVLSLIELAGNRLLSFDSPANERLQRLKGKVIELEVKTFQISLFLTPVPEGFELSAHSPKSAEGFDIPADVTLKTTLRALAKISKDGIENAELDAGELEIIGDAIVGQRFASLLGQINIDWEEVMAQQFGDSTAHFINLTSTKIAAAVNQTGQQLKHKLSDLIQNEFELTASPDNTHTFLDDVDNLRADVDRLIARIAQLQQKANDD